MRDGRATDDPAGNGQPATSSVLCARLWRRHGWLPLAVPVGARVFWTDDPRLAESVVAAGGVLDRHRTDMELATRRGAVRRVDAPSAAVTLGVRRADHGVLVARRAARVLRGLRIQVAGVREGRALRRAGYTSAVRIVWDDDRASFRQPSGDRLALAAGARLFPVGLSVVAQADEDDSSVFAGAVERAAVAVDSRLGLREVLIRDTCVVGVGRREVIRVGLGVGGEAVRRHVTALERLASLDPASGVSSRVPRPRADGSLGLGYWACESRLDGRGVVPGADGIEDDCLAFQLDLSRVWRGPVSQREHALAARTVAAASPASGSTVAFVAARVAELLEGHVGVLGHGDFFHGNLLASGGRLVGVLDWDRSAPGRPAGHDLVHQRIAARVPRHGGHYGRVVHEMVESRPVPEDAPLHAYFRALAVSIDDASLAAIVGSCWLLHIAHEVNRLADNVADRVWLDENVDAPALALARRLTAVDAARRTETLRR